MDTLKSVSLESQDWFKVIDCLKIEEASLRTKSLHCKHLYREVLESELFQLKQLVTSLECSLELDNS
jgi:hypothetical protein